MAAFDGGGGGGGDALDLGPHHRHVLLVMMTLALAFMT